MASAVSILEIMKASLPPSANRRRAMSTSWGCVTLDSATKSAPDSAAKLSPSRDLSSMNAVLARVPVSLRLDAL